MSASPQRQPATRVIIFRCCKFTIAHAMQQTTRSHNSLSKPLAQQLLDEEESFIEYISVAINEYVISSSHQFTKTPLHNGSWTGIQRLYEWKTLRPRGMAAALGVETPAFLALARELQDHSTLRDARYVSAEEQLAIFLYICRGRESIRRTAEEFQRSLDTVSV